MTPLPEHESIKLFEWFLLQYFICRHIFSLCVYIHRAVIFYGFSVPIHKLLITQAKIEVIRSEPTK